MKTVYYNGNIITLEGDNIQAFAVENATLNIKLKNGTVVSKIIPAQKRSDGSARIRVPKEEIPEGFVYFDIIADNATAMKGEDGFWIFGRGERLVT